MEFKDQVVVVSGGTRGIGAAIAKSFLQEGASVVATYLSNEAAAADFRESCGEHRDRLELRACDTSQAPAVEALFAAIDNKYSGVDVLVNNAGIRRDAILGMMTEEDWDQVLGTNLKGCFLMSKQAVMRMSRKRYGRIIQITSPSGQMGFPGQGNYAASKAGQVGLARSLAKEVAKRNITVNCVSPGFIGTDLLKDLKDDMREKYKNMVPMERFGTVEEVAYAVRILASRQASYITGALLEVTGGL